jgi:hypothetical protein
MEGEKGTHAWNRASALGLDARPECPAPFRGKGYGIPGTWGMNMETVNQCNHRGKLGVPQTSSSGHQLSSHAGLRDHHVPEVAVGGCGAARPATGPAEWWSRPAGSRLSFRRPERTAACGQHIGGLRTPSSAAIIRRGPLSRSTSLFTGSPTSIVDISIPLG